MRFHLQKKILDIQNVEYDRMYYTERERKRERECVCVKETSVKPFWLQGLRRRCSNNRGRLDQWFSTGVPRHTRVPWDSVRGAASYQFLLMFWPILASRGAAKHWFSWTRVPQGKKRLRNTDLKDTLIDEITCKVRKTQFQRHMMLV